MTNTIHDVVIVGSGPAGYTAAIYAARANLSPLVFASSVTAGGELMNTTEVENFPGFPQAVMGPELMQKMEEQASKFGADIRHEDVTHLELKGDVKKITTDGGETLEAHTVILATGSAYRHLGIEGEERLSGTGVSWCATCDGFFFKEKKVFVIGGGDSAMEEAIFLTKFASNVTIVHRRDELRASKIMQDRAKANDKISFMFNTETISLNGETALESITVKENGEEKTLPADGVFIAIGHDPRTDLVKDALDLTEDGTIALQGRSSKTSQAGVFAAGDVTDSTYRQAITAAASGTIAAIDVEHYLADIKG